MKIEKKDLPKGLVEFTIVVDTEEFEKLFQVDNTLSKQESEEEQAKVIKKIHRLLRPFMLRRLKSDVETNLAPKKEIYLYVGMSTV